MYMRTTTHAIILFYYQHVTMSTGNSWMGRIHINDIQCYWVSCNVGGD